MTTKKRPTSIRLTDAARELLAALADHMGLTQASVMEVLIRNEAERRQIKLASESHAVPQA